MSLECHKDVLKDLIKKKKDVLKEEVVLSRKLRGTAFVFFIFGVKKNPYEI